MDTRSFLSHAILVTAFLLAPFGPAVALQGVAPGVIVDPTVDVWTSEAGSTALLSVVLDFPPTADVTVSVQSTNPAEGSVTPAELVFTVEQWAASQQVTVTGMPDDIDDGDQPYAVQFAVSSADPGYDGLAVPDVPVTNVDIDTAGVQVNPAAGLATDENGATDSFSVALLSRPTAPLTVQAQSLTPGEAAVSPAAVTIQPENWSQPAEFTVTGLPDDRVDGDAPFTIDLALATDDPLYAAQVLPDVTGVNADASSAGAVVTPTAGLVTDEDGATDTFSVWLTSRPADTVTIAAASQTPAEASVSPASVDILPDDWNLPVIFTVTGLPDTAVDGTVAFTIALSTASTDTHYNGLLLPAVSGENADRSSPLAAVDDNYPVNEDTVLNVPAPGILANDTSPGARTVALPLASEPAVGVLVVQASGSFQYTPPEDYAGTVMFGYRITDGTNTSAVATVTIAVQPVNDPPVAVGDAYLTNKVSVTLSQASVLLNDHDAEDDTLSAVLYTGADPVKGSVVQNASGSFTFTAAEKFEGQATFTYRAFDGEAYSQPATVTVTVDRTKPVSPVWVSPPTSSETYFTTGRAVTLQVTVPPDAIRVWMYRWDHVEKVYYDLVVIESPPYVFTIDASGLPVGQNQVFAVCTDAAGNQSDRKRIIIDFQPNLEPQAYLPVIVR